MTRVKALGRWAIVPALLLASLGTADAQTRLVDAVKAADKAAVRALLTQHVDVNAPQADRYLRHQYREGWTL